MLNKRSVRVGFATLSGTLMLSVGLSGVAQAATPQAAAARGASLAQNAQAASGDATVGELFDNTAPCGGSPYTQIQGASPNSSFTVPFDGVITSVQMTGDPNSSAIRAFRLARPGTTAGTYTIVGQADTVTIPAGETSTQSVRIPAQAGDVLGETVFDNTSCARSADQSYNYLVTGGDPAVGTPTSFGGGNGYEISVAATVEPDADGDGYGDTTQDLCPTDASTQAACPASTQPTQPTQPTAVGSQSFSLRSHHRANHRVQVNAAGLNPAQAYTLKLGKRTVASGIASATGVVDVSFKIPACIFKGKRLLRLTNSDGHVLASKRISIHKARPGYCS